MKKILKRTLKIIIALAVTVILGLLFDVYPKIILPFFDTVIKPTPEEVETIREIRAFEDEVLRDCKNRIAEYDDEQQELGITIRAELEQERWLYGARYAKYHLDETKRIPREYISNIVCYAYKGGTRLSKQMEYDLRITQLYAMMFRTVQLWNPHTFNKEVWLMENPLEDFDEAMESLLKSIQEDFG